MMRLFRGVLCVFCGVGQLWAAGDNLEIMPIKDSLSFDLKEVVVTATRTPLMLKEAPVITRVITARDMERRGVVTIQQALENELAGVEFHQAGYGTSLSFQGLDARYVLFLVDGERMAGETYGNIDYARIPMANIDRIEIVRGASSVLYGSNAMGAVVNVITRMPRQKVEVGASVRYGTPFQNNGNEALGSSKKYTPTPENISFYRRKLDLNNLKGDLSVGFNTGKFQSLTTLGYRATDAYKVVGTRDEVRHYAAGELLKMGPKMNGSRPVMDPSTGMPVFMVKGTNLADTTVIVAPDQRGMSVSGWQDMNLSQRFDYVLSKKFRFELSGTYFNKKRYDFNGSILDENPMSNNTKPWTHESYQGYSTKILMEHSPNERNKIYLSYVHDGYQRELDSLSGSSVPKQKHAYNIPRLLWTLQAGQHRLTTGLEMLNEQLNFDLNPQGYDQVKSMTTTSLYVQDEVRTQKALSFTLGVRGDYNDRFGGRFTPKASVKYSLGKYALRANYAHGYRTPSLKEMYMELMIPMQGQTYIRGNADLKPETNDYLSLSGEYNRDGFNLSATLYKSFFRNKIDVRGRTEGVKTILQYENISRSEMSGVEVMMRVRLAQGLFMKGNYNYLAQTDDAPANSTQYIYPSPHTATLQADYGFDLWGAYWGVNVLARYVGPKTYEDFMTILEGNSMATMTKFWMGNYSAHHDGYVVCSAALNLSLRQNLSFTLGMENIGNYRPRVVNFNSAMLPRRNAFLRVSYVFGMD